MTSAGTLRAAAPALALAALITLPLLGARDLWAPDEPRHAEVAREMLADGRWWYPHVNSRPYPDKPPLYFWLAAAMSAPLGAVSEATARLPSALAALVLVLLVADIGTRLVSPSAGRIAAFVMGTTWLAAWMSRRVSLDVLLSLCVTASLWCALRGRLLAPQAGARRAVTAWLAASGAAAALAVMTKGPVALLFLAAALVPLAAQAGRRGEALPAAAGAAALAAFAGVLAAWLIPARLLGGYDPWGVVREHVVERAAQGRDHVQPAWYYLTTVPVDFLPWSLLAIPALVAAWRARRQWQLAWLVAWALVPLLVLSVIVEKRNLYALPLLPAWAVLAGWWLTREEPGTSPPLAWTRAATRAAAAVLVLLGAGAAAVLAPPVSDRLALPDGPHARAAFAALGFVSVAGGLALWRLARRATILPLAAAWGVAFGAVEACLFATLPAFDEVKSGRRMGEIVARETGEAPIGMFPRTWDAYVFYSGRSMADLVDEDAAAAWLAGSGRPAYVLAYRSDEAAIRSLPGRAEEIERDTVGHREIVLWRFGAEP